MNLRLLLTKVWRTKGAQGALREQGKAFGYDSEAYTIFYQGRKLTQAAHIDYEGKTWEEIAVAIHYYEVNEFGFLQLKR